MLVADDGTGYGTPDASGYPGDLGWNTAVGYDYATGLGSVNAYNLVQQWSSANFLSSAVTLSLSNTSFVHGGVDDRDGLCHIQRRDAIRGRLLQWVCNQRIGRIHDPERRRWPPSR